MGRFIGIAHRVKRTAKGEARPTMVCIKADGKLVTHKLATETDELDFILARFPVKCRQVTESDNLSQFNPHQIKWRKLNLREERPSDFPGNLLQQKGKTWFIATQVPVVFAGLKTEDTVAMILGGSGDDMAYAIANVGAEIGAKLLRIAPARFKECRGNAAKRPDFVNSDSYQILLTRDEDDDEQMPLTKDDDHLLLTQLVLEHPELFQEISPRDKALIEIIGAFRERTDAMKARIACEQRLRWRTIGATYRSPAGQYPEGSLEDLYRARRANDVIYQALLKEEAEREVRLTKMVEALDIYQQLFKPIEGCGPMLAVRIIVTIGDIRRFPNKAKFKAYCGVHCLADGSFPRRREGSTANWANDGRQAFWLLVADQFNRRPDSLWGKAFRRWKEIIRQRHPKVIKVEVRDPDRPGKTKWVKRYTDAHIHKMGIWRTATKFAERFYQDWKALYQQEETKAASQAA